VNTRLKHTIGTSLLLCVCACGGAQGSGDGQQGESALDQLTAMPAQLAASADKVLEPINRTDAILVQLETLPDKLGIAKDDYVEALTTLLAGQAPKTPTGLTGAAQQEWRDFVNNFIGVKRGIVGAPDAAKAFAADLLAAAAKVPALAAKAKAEMEVEKARLKVNPFASSAAKAEVLAKEKRLNSVVADVEAKIAELQQKVTGLPKRAQSSVQTLVAKLEELGVDDAMSALKSGTRQAVDNRLAAVAPGQSPGPPAVKTLGGGTPAPIRSGERGEEGVSPKVTATVGHAQHSVQAAPAGPGAIVWVSLPGGTFRMGSNDGDADEKPAHAVTLSPFQMAKTATTVAQYAACVRAGACSAAHFDDGKCDVWNGSKWVKGRLPNSFRNLSHPVVCVDWQQASSFCQWAGGRLPSEAQWEYAARSGGQDWKYPWGSDGATCRRTVVSSGGTGCGRQSTWRVCSRPAGNTRQGLCDMAGNVWEWVQDWYDWGYYSKSPKNDPVNNQSAYYRVGRGGGWVLTADYVRAADRAGGAPGDSGGALGFRCAR